MNAGDHYRKQHFSIDYNDLLLWETVRNVN